MTEVSLSHDAPQRANTMTRDSAIKGCAGLKIDLYKPLLLSKRKFRRLSSLRTLYHPHMTSPAKCGLSSAQGANWRILVFVSLTFEENQPELDVHMYIYIYIYNVCVCVHIVLSVWPALSVLTAVRLSCFIDKGKRETGIR